MRNRAMTVLSFVVQYCPIVLAVVMIGWVLLSDMSNISHDTQVVAAESFRKEVVSKDHALTLGLVLLGLALLPRLYLRRKYPVKTQGQ